jgi:hypothetical protein
MPAMPKTHSVSCPELDTAPMERRVEPRQPSGQFAYLSHRPDLDATYQVVRVWNFANKGIGIFLSRPLKAGTAVHLRFRHMVVEDRVATVVHVTKEEGNWLVGCTLDRDFSARERQALQF